MATNEANGKVELSTAWLDDDEDIVEEDETVFEGGSESPYMQGYGVQTAKVTMAKRITFDTSKVEFIELDLINKEGKTHREKFMVRGKDGKTYFTRGGKKTQHFGINKIKSLLKVGGVYPDTDPKKLMAELYGNTEDMDVTWEEFGKEKTEECTVFVNLIDVKVKICITSKKENSQLNVEQDDSSDQKYVKACMKATKAYVKANPKKKSLKKFDDDEATYVNVYRWFTVSSISHFCSVKGLFASEMADGEGKLLAKFEKANEEGLIFEGRTLIAEELSDGQRSRLGINEWGKRVDPDEATDDEPEAEAEESESAEEEDDDWN